MPGGQRSRGRGTRSCATSATVVARVGVPRTTMSPSTMSRSLRRCFEQMGGDRGDLRAQFLRRESDRGAEDRAAAASAGAERVRRLARVALMDRHRVERDTEMLGDELRGRGLDALSVRPRAEVHVDTAARLDADVRRLGGVGPHRRPAARCTARCRSRAAVPARNCSCCGAEAVVVDDRRRLLQRLRRRHMSRGVCRRAEVTAARRRWMTLRRRSSSGSMPDAARAGRASVRAGTSRSATGPGTAHARTCW